MAAISQEAQARLVLAKEFLAQNGAVTPELAYDKLMEAKCYEEALSVLEYSRAIVHNLMFDTKLRMTERDREIIDVSREHNPYKLPVSVCIITLNEEKNIERCLRSLGEVSGEIIVMDTGSVDRTREIASELGSTIYDHEWQDSFAEARNACIATAEEEWTLWLDADDELPAESLDQIKNLLVHPKHDAYCFNIRNKTPTGTIQTAQHIRLWRNRKGVQFVGRVHETQYVSIVNNQLKLADTDIDVIHHGYEEGDRSSARNLRLLELQYAETPTYELELYIGMANHALGDHKSCIEWCTRGLDKSLEENKFKVFDSLKFWACCAVVESHEALGDRRMAYGWIKLAQQYFEDHAYLKSMEGLVLYEAGLSEECKEPLRDALIFQSPGVELSPERKAQIGAILRGLP